MNGCARLIVTVTGKYMPVIVAEGVPGYVVCLGTMSGVTRVSIAQVTPYLCMRADAGGDASLDLLCCN